MKKTVLAIDLGAESGRVMAVHFDGRQLKLEELHRFANTPISENGTLYWDIYRLWEDILFGIKEGEKFKPVSIGVDTWGVDFALLDKDGQLVSDPVHYRDARTENVMENVFKIIPQKDIFNQTGIQFLPFNTIYQLTSMVKRNAPELKDAHSFLTIPDLINFWLTGKRYCEFTNATTTQLFNPGTKDWACNIMETLNIPSNIFPEIIQPGTHIGHFRDIPVVAVASHDTGSAVAAVPVSDENFAYISSGTWSLIGIELANPIINDKALQLNITNEGGVYETYRLLKNVMGLWIIQQCRKMWQKQDDHNSYSHLTDLARKTTPFNSIINPNDQSFLSPGDHPKYVQDFCKKTGQKVPQSKGEIVRCVLESLACAYRDVIEAIELLTHKTVDKVHIVGGGTQNTLLNQMTANATGLPVITGPVEATVIGNALVQLISSGEIKDINQGRELVGNLNEIKEYLPEKNSDWDDIYLKYKQL